MNKEKIKKTYRERQGITLIALVITIIVLLILAGVAIVTLTGDNGIIENAKNAKETTENAEQDEEEILLQNEYIMWKQMQESKGEIGTVEKFANDKYKDVFSYLEADDIYIITTESGKEVKINSDGEIIQSSGNIEKPELPITIADGDNLSGIKDKTIDGKTASYRNPIIPSGFKSVDKTIDSTIDENASWTSKEGYKYGLVIQDSSGNQFVWIAVDGTNVALNRYEFDSSLNEDRESYTKYSEILDTEWSKKVNEYGGFYIGRYETQYLNNKCVISKGNIPTVSITRDTARGYAQLMDTSYGYSTVTTDLLNSYMWDTALKYIDYYTDSSFSTTLGLGNAAKKNDRVVASGSYSDDIKCNIADLSGNACEWTTEFYNSNNKYGYRGGYYYLDHAACRRYSYGSKDSHDSLGFRCALYW